MDLITCYNAVHLRASISNENVVACDTDGTDRQITLRPTSVAMGRIYALRACDEA